MKKLPLSIQTFRKMIEQDYLYVDKTQGILDLISQGGYFFLSRPRRFGKSLLLSTLKEIFSGNKDLFKELYIYDKIDWQPHPVVHLDFMEISYHTPEVLQQALSAFLNKTAEILGVSLSEQFLKEQFIELLRKLAEHSQHQVVVLVDEYDKPIVDYIDDTEKAKKNREILREFYGVLKAADPYLKFVFLTGVSKFSRVSIFSGLNNLRDITLSSQFATIAGYTQEELEHYFDEHLQQFCQHKQISHQDLLEQIKHWYNGYSWNGKDLVYNPFSILNLFAEQRFSNYWFATGTPTFLLNLINTEQIEPAEFERKEVSEVVFDSYDIEKMNVFALLFQTGYLTITQAEMRRTLRYMLDYPNFEVKEAFLTYLFESFTTNRVDEVQTAAEDLREYLRKENYEGFMNLIRALFAKIPYPLHIKQEAYYHSLFYMILTLMGVEIDLEVLTDKGRIDGVLEFEEKIFLIECKYGKAGSDPEKLTEQAIQQIRSKKYAQRFHADPRKRLLLGVGFADKEMNYKIVEEKE